MDILRELVSVLPTREVSVKVRTLVSQRERLEPQRALSAGEGVAGRCPANTARDPVLSTARGASSGPIGMMPPSVARIGRRSGKCTPSCLAELVPLARRAPGRDPSLRGWNRFAGSAEKSRKAHFSPASPVQPAGAGGSESMKPLFSNEFAEVPC